MSEGVLVIGEKETQALKAAMERARKHPVPVCEFMRMAATIDQSTDRVTLAERVAAAPQRPQSEMVSIPVGYRVAISYEEQPAGICLHLSISSRRPKKTVPGPQAVAMVLNAIGFNLPMPNEGRIWIEEFLEDGKPGGNAVNIVITVEPAQVGHA